MTTIPKEFNTHRDEVIRSEVDRGSAESVEQLPRLASANSKRICLRARWIYTSFLQVTRVLRIFLSLLMVYWMSSTVNWGELLTLVWRHGLWLAVAVISLGAAAVQTGAYRWQRLLKVHGLEYKLRDLRNWYVIGLSLNQVFPTTISGDGYRINKTLDDTTARWHVVLPVVIGRLLGLASLLIMAYLAAIMQYLHDGDPLSGYLCGIGLFGAASLAAVFLGFQRWARASLRTRSKALGVYANAMRAIRVYGLKSSHVQMSVLVSFAFNVYRSFVFWLLLYSLGSKVRPESVVLAIAAADLATLLPISLGGLGVFETSFAHTLDYYGTSQAIGFSAALLIRLVLAPATLALGAWLYATGRD